MAENQNPRPAVSPAEWEIMKVLWEHGPLAARDVFAALPPDHGWAYKTVKTLLSRLVAKEAAAYDQIGNSYLYRAAVDRGRLSREEVRSVIDRLASGVVSPVLAHFIDEADLSEAEIEKLKQLLEAKQKKQARAKRGKKQ